MSNNPRSEPGQSIVYQIRLRGHLSDQWTNWCEGLTITLEEDGDTLLTGPIVDQAALFGLLKKVRDLGMPLISINCVELGNPDMSSTSFIKGENEMKAIVYTKYGPPDVLQLKEVAKPEPKEDQVLVKVRAASINALDYRRFEKLSTTGRIMEERLIKSVGKVLGADISGVVEAVGAKVKQFQPGDEVFGVSAGSVGGFAEYTCAVENNLALKPANIVFEAAAAVPVAGLTALQGLRDKGQIQAGQRVLIQGASGGVGTFAVQIAKAFGAEVTAVCSTRNPEMARSIGADHVIDYNNKDFTKNGQRYDLIFAVNGYHPLSAYRQALNPEGNYVCAGGALPQILQAMLLGSLMSKRNGKKMGFMGIAKPNQKDLMDLGELLEDGKVVPVIEKCYPLDEVPAAIRYVAEVHARGKVVIQISLSF